MSENPRLDAAARAILPIFVQEFSLDREDCWRYATPQERTIATEMAAQALEAADAIPSHDVRDCSATTNGSRPNAT